MGKKVKKGKQRKDVFYHRAKEAGYRARASYKLIQLNKKYNFLQSSRVCIDLCAAPGSWMQVCSKMMPVSSVIIGVDRYSIAPIPNTLSIQGDITTEKLRQELKVNLKSWKADLVLHDGAPNVGQNWLYDAYQQNLLVLHSFKLACEFLQKGGNFVTKVFRSRDHLSLQYVFRKLFKKVEATKPIASRFESAEIFVVCLGFLAPDKIDQEFFDPHHVFQSLEKEPKNTINVLKPEKTKKKAMGYEEGITMLYKKKNISEFLNSPNYIDLLEETNEFEWDSPSALSSAHTTNEILEIVKDIKLLGRKDLRALINWRKAIKADMEEEEEESKEEEKKKRIEEEEKEEENKDKDKEEIEQDFEELKLIQEQITQLKADQDRDSKHRRKRLDKKRKRLEERMKLRLLVPGDAGPQEGGAQGLFELKTLNMADTIDSVVDQNVDLVLGSDVDTDSDAEKIRPNKEYYEKGSTYLHKSAKFYKTANDSSTEEESEYATSEDEGLDLTKTENKEKKREKKRRKKSVRFADEEGKEEEEEGSDDDEGKTNPLLTDLVGDNLEEKRERKAELWFSKEVFGELETDEVEDYELAKAIKSYKKSGVEVQQRKREDEEEEEEDEEEEEEEGREKQTKKKSKLVNGIATDKGQKTNRKKVKDEFSAKDAPDSDSEADAYSESDSDMKSDSGLDSEEDEDDAGDAKKVRNLKRKAELDSHGLALATQMIRSKKAMRDLYDEGWNRYMYGDEDDLPDWFVKSEKAHNSRRMAVDKADVTMYDERNKAVDARSIKKVVEASARKKRRIKKRMQGAKKKAEVVANNEDMSAREKATEMKKIYRKATNSLKPKSKTYVVMKKTFGGRKPKGVKGPSRMVDGRMKKDKRAVQRATLRNKKKGKNQAPNKRPKGKKAKARDE